MRAVSTVWAVALIWCALLSPAAKAAPAPVQNPIQLENAQPGTDAWQVHGGGSADLYATPTSAAPGDEIDLHVSASASYRLTIYRLGWYGGAGARLMTCVPACDAYEPGKLLSQKPGLGGGAAGWPVTDVIRTGADWTSGYYLVEALLTNGGVATGFFILHDAPGQQPASQIVVQVPINTWQAYNTWGGASLYNFLGPRSTAVSLERPLGHLAQSPMWWEIQLVRFLEREGYDVSYQTDLDTHVDPASLLRHRLVIDAGHDEYWSNPIRDGFEAALAGGTNLAFMGSNDAYWNVRYVDDNKTILSAKSLYDPNPVLREKTAMFREIGRPECMIMGVLHNWFGTIPRSLDYTVPTAAANDPWFAGTGLTAGAVVAGVVGREHDVLNPFPDSCIHPGLSVLFHYDGAGADQDADAVRFTVPSGARVFASGAQQFTWALDDWRSDGSLFPPPPVEPWRGVPVDARVQQFMRNALNDLTRPAAPTGLTGTLSDATLHVAVDATVDPNVDHFSAFVRVQNKWVRVCSGKTSCDAAVSPTRRGFRVVAVQVDDWHRRSAGSPIVIVRRQP